MRCVPWAAAVLVCLGSGVIAQERAGSATPLESYLRLPDNSFEWEARPTQESSAGRTTDIALTSQSWHGVIWKHDLRVYEPPKGTVANAAAADAMLLFISGGGTGHSYDEGDDAFGFGLARLTGARVAMLPQVPNQPLFGDMKEDTAIAETFIRYLDTKDPTWPLLFPMVKSAVRAMDSLQAWAEREGQPVKRFVVTGGSKRGWTTWLTSAVDPRVIALAPMVIDVLNFPAQKRHWDEFYGGPTDEVSEYTDRGLVDAMVSPEGRPLWAMVDPYSFRDRLTKPKLLVLGTNDPFWSLDALNIYWDDLSGPKHVVYVPNAGHGLEPNRDYALEGIGAFFRRVSAGKPLPEMKWSHGDAADGALTLEVTTPDRVERAQVWVATAPGRDFRKVRWEPRPMEGNGSTYRVRVARPESGYIALWGDVRFADEVVPFHLATQIRQVPATSTASPAASSR